MNMIAAVERYQRIKNQIEHQAFVEKRAVSAVEQVGLGNRPRVPREVAKVALLRSPWTICGQMIKVGSKSVGAGVYELYSIDAVYE